MKNRKGARGFTLVELLLAVAVMAVLAPAVGRALIGMVRDWRAFRADSFERQAARSALDVFERDVRRFIDAPGVGFKGDSGGVEFVAIVPLLQSARVAGLAARRVRYEAAVDGWSRAEAAVRPDDETPPRRLALPGRVRFEFGAVGRDAPGTWDWKETWTGGCPPPLIRIKLRWDGKRGENEWQKTVALPGGSES